MSVNPHKSRGLSTINDPILSWVRISVLPLTVYVSLGKLLNVSDPLGFLICKMREMRVFWRLVINTGKDISILRGSGMRLVIIVINVVIILVASCWATLEGLWLSGNWIRWPLISLTTLHIAPGEAGEAYSSGSQAFWNQTDRVLNRGSATFLLGKLSKGIEWCLSPTVGCGSQIRRWFI